VCCKTNDGWNGAHAEREKVHRISPGKHKDDDDDDDDEMPNLITLGGRGERTMRCS